MAHELDGLRTIYKFNFDGNKAILELQEHETVDLRSMEPDGNLPNGFHVTPRTAFPIKGRAYRHNGETFLTFSHQGGAPGTFIGQVVFRAGDKVIVAGTLSTLDQFDVTTAEGKQQAERALEQQEQPIIITKP